MIAGQAIFGFGVTVAVIVGIVVVYKRRAEISELAARVDAEPPAREAAVPGRAAAAPDGAAAGLRGGGAAAALPVEPRHPRRARPRALDGPRGRRRRDLRVRPLRRRALRRPRADAARHRVARRRRRAVQRDARRRGEGRERLRLTRGGPHRRRQRGDPGRRLSALDRGHRAGRRVRPDLCGGAHHEGRDRAAAPCRSARR